MAFLKRHYPIVLGSIGRLMRLAPRLDPRAPRGTSLPAAYETIIASALLLVLACHGIVLAVALAHPASLGMPVVLGAVVAAVIGPAVYSYLAWRRVQSR